jgi:hypothetical protein
VELEDDRTAVAVLDWKADGLLLLVVLDFPFKAVVSLVTLCAWQLANRTTGTHLELSMMSVASCGNSLRQELEGTNIPPKHVRRKTSFDTAEEERDTDATKAYTAIKRVPSCYLRAGVHDVGQLERHDSEDGIMLAVARITHSDCDDSGSPIADESLGTSVEDGLTAHCLGTSSVNQLIVVEDGTVTSRKLVTLFVSAFTAGLGRLVLSALATAFCTLDVIKLEVDNLVDDDTANTTGPERIWRCVLNSVIRVSVGHTLVILEFGLVAKVFRKGVVLAIGTKSRSELRLAEEANLPVEFTGHLAIRIHTSKLGHLRVHFAGVLDHLLHGQFDLSDNVIGGVTVRIPKFDTQVLVGLD